MIAAAAAVSGEREIVVIGSQAILGSVDEPPADLLFSMEADVYPLNDPAKAIDIDANLGDGSPFHGTFGYYAHGVGPETARVPAGWMDRLVRVEIPPRVRQGQTTIALCLEVHDLVLSKCVAGRDRDWEFARSVLEAGIVELDELIRRAGDLPVDGSDQMRVRKMLEGIARRLELD